MCRILDDSGGENVKSKGTFIKAATYAEHFVELSALLLRLTVEWP